MSASAHVHGAGLPRTTSAQGRAARACVLVDRGVLGDRENERGDRGTELVADVLDGPRCVFDDVVEEPGDLHPFFPPCLGQYPCDLPERDTTVRSHAGRRLPTGRRRHRPGTAGAGSRRAHAGTVPRRRFASQANGASAGAAATTARRPHGPRRLNGKEEREVQRLRDAAEHRVSLVGERDRGLEETFHLQGRAHFDADERVPDRRHSRSRAPLSAGTATARPALI